MSKELMQQFAQAAHGYGRDNVISAAANLILNVLRQSHDRLPAAQEELTGLAVNMQRDLRENHYTKDGTKNGLLIVTPELDRWLRSEGLVR